MTESRHPRPVSPQGGETVPSGSVTLEWESPGKSETHHVQVSDSDRFQNLLVDTSVGTARSLSLLGVLPQDGRRLYWRVSVHKDSWSEPASFQAGGARPSARPSARTAARTAAARPLGPNAGPATGSSAASGAVAAPAVGATTGEVPLYMTAVTGSGEVYRAILVLAALVLFLVVVLAF